MQDADSLGMLRELPALRKDILDGNSLPVPWHIPELEFFLIMAVFSHHSQILLPL